MSRKLTLFFICLFPVVSSQAQSLILLDKDETEFLGTYATILEDPSRNLKIEDVLKLKDKFKMSNQEVISRKGGLSSYWFSFKIKIKDDKKHYLEVSNPKLNYIDLYTVIDDKVIDFQKNGDQIPFKLRNFKKVNFIYNLDLPKEQTATLYLHLTDPKGLLLPVKIKSREQLYDNFSNLDLLNGMYYGIMLFAILYNLFLYMMIKDHSYIYYIIFVSACVLQQAEMLGHTYQYLWPDCPWFNKQGVYLFSALFGFAAIPFMRIFLQTKIRIPKLHFCGYIIQGIMMTILIIALFKNVPDEIILVNHILCSVCGFLFSIFMISSGILVYRQGYTPARFFLLAWTIFIIGIISVLLSVNSLLPHQFHSFDLLQIGSALEAILISMALGEKYSLLKKEKEETQRILNNELEKSNLNLLRINSDLDNFVYTASHDLKAPITNIEGLINILKSNPDASQQEISNIVKMISTSIDKFKNIIVDLSEISKVQKNQDIDIEVNDANEVIEEIQFLLKNQIDNSGVKIDSNFSEISKIKFSRKNFRSILYNLIINAINYRSHERAPHIFIKTQKNNEYIILSINDNGLGVPDDYQTKIFQLFKRAHSHIEGTGIGLYIVKRIIENEGGKIELESKEGEGSTFKVFFKINFHELTKENFVNIE